MKELIAELEFDIRFSETDAMGVVWHGNYLKYFEDGREAFAKKFGMSYLEIHSNEYFTPIVKSEVNHKSPIYYGQRAKVTTKMIPSKAAKIIFEYEIINLSTKKISATGSTTQVFLTEKSRELELQFPDFYLDWEKKDWYKKMKTYIGAENIISPLGATAEDNFNLIKNGQTGIKLFKEIGFGKVDVYLSKINETSPNNFFYFLLKQCLSSIIKDVSPEIIKSQGTIVLISTTKADIIENITSPIIKPIQQLKKDFNLHHSPIVISNACISGVLAINVANNLIQSGKYKHAFVIGADVISDFVLYGFQSLFAISNEPCQPFDKNRKGITLGEGAGGVLVSNDSTVFESPCFEFVEGTSSNDANHISGPSRTGEGLFRTVSKTLTLASIKPHEIDFISAHGTGTSFNDEMEAIAFNRLGMNEIPLNSLKGYFGHTLGASGLIETAICLQSMRNNVLIKSRGFEKIGTTKALNILTQNKETEVNTILKTASGFGGCNASLIIRKL